MNTLDFQISVCSLAKNDSTIRNIKNKGGKSVTIIEAPMTKWMTCSQDASLNGDKWRVIGFE